MSSISDTESASPNTDSMPQDGIQKSDQCCTRQNDDIETGSAPRGIDPPEGDEDEQKDELDDIYTHVSVPLPGHNFDCVKILHSGDSGPSKKEKRSKIRVFASKENDTTKDAEEEPNTSNENGTRRRSCPRFCAVCLDEFEISERVSWSSNPACTHVFHEDCVTQWLVSLGRTKTKLQKFSENPSEAQLLNYELECPCCRQDFISIEKAELVDTCAREESV